MDSMDRMQQKDLVLNVNEYAYVLDQTKGNVVCWVGPSKTSLSNSDQLVTFNEKTKRFVPCGFTDAVKLFTTAPKGWYVVLKNPAKDRERGLDKHPGTGTSNSIPEGMEVGKKINIEGPVSFALYPGQMAKVIEGHILRSNQYIMVRVYDADAAAKSTSTEKAEKTYTPGQMMVIKGTEVSFYIPPTGFEIVKNNGSFVQDAVTLEKLEYCILKNENGNKRYVQGPAVVFPEPTESFITNDDGSFKFRAIELSKISGIYIKVIEEYKENGKEYHIGDELFITGNDQMIYYPRPEHAIIQYGEKIVHHSIAIPKGEGRYLMNRLTGEIKTVIGSMMLLPDPRKEVIVKRKLSRQQCELWYPGNREVLDYNGQLDEKVNRAISDASYSLVSADNVGYYTADASSHVSKNIAAKAADAFARSEGFTKPRTITLDTKYDGVVRLDIWTGYAVNIISSNGDRRVVVGPQSVLLNYDETLEVLSLSTGKPKTTDILEKTVFLRCENNNVGDIVRLETKDYIPVEVKLSYIIDFVKEYMDDWFKVENYVKFLCDRMRSKLKCIIKNYTIAEFYNNSSKIIRDAVMNIDEGNETGTVLFPENGMLLKDVEILVVKMDRDIESLMEEYQRSIIKNTLKLSTSEQGIDISRKLAKIDEEEKAINHAMKMNGLELRRQAEQAEMEASATLARMREIEDAKRDAARQAALEKELQMNDLKRTDEQAERDAGIEYAKAQSLLKQEAEIAHAEAVKSVLEAISPTLVQAMMDDANAKTIAALTENMAPYAIAKNEGVVEVAQQLLRGTPVEAALKDIFQK